MKYSDQLKNLENIIKIIEAINVSYAYDLENPVFQNVNFEIQEGEFWGILGKNGAGKTSLIDVLVGTRWADTGDLKIMGESIRVADKEYLKYISFLSHDVQLAGKQKISDFLSFHSHFYENYSKKIEEELLQYFNIDPKIELYKLSTGQQKKIQIIAALSANTKIIIIDEVTAVLDPETRARLYIKLHEHSKQFNRTVILATNILEDLEVYADKILYVDNKTASVHLPIEMKGIMAKL